jgi:hypothetical protein
VRNVAYTFPASQGAASTLLTNNGSGTLTWAAAPAAGFTLGTPVASTSGTSIDFTGIPATARQIVVHLKGVGIDYYSNILVQIGDSGGVETSGYEACGSDISSIVNTQRRTDGFIARFGEIASYYYGNMTLNLENSSTNSWSCVGGFIRGGSTITYVNTGSKSLSATLDRVRITTTDATTNFNLGEVNVSYI